MFDVTKCDEIFDLLVADGQVAVPNSLKIPPLEMSDDFPLLLEKRTSLSPKSQWLPKDCPSQVEQVLLESKPHCLSGS